jgi:hypothetical protein
MTSRRAVHRTPETGHSRNECGKSRNKYVQLTTRLRIRFVNARDLPVNAGLSVIRILVFANAAKSARYGADPFGERDGVSRFADAERFTEGDTGMELRNRATRGALAVALAGALTASGCGGSGGTAVQGTARPNSSGTPNAAAARSAAAGAYDANKLRGGLLTSYETARPAAPASAGTVGALQDRLGLSNQLKSIKTRKRACLTAGPNLTARKLRQVPASAVTLTEPKRGYTLGEVLFSTDVTSMRALIARRVPPVCRHLTANVSGTKVRVALREIRMPKVARTINGVMMTVLVGRRAQRSLTVMFATRKYGGTISLSGRGVTRAMLHRATVTAIRAARRTLA